MSDRKSRLLNIIQQTIISKLQDASPDFRWCWVLLTYKTIVDRVVYVRKEDKRQKKATASFSIQAPTNEQLSLPALAILKIPGPLTLTNRMVDHTENDLN